MARSSFGSIQKKPSKRTPKWLEASYKPPVWAYAKWPELMLRPTTGKPVERVTKRFPLGFEGEARGWLSEAERAIILETWEPPARSEAKSKASSITFAEYATAYVETEHRKRNGEPLGEQTKEKYRQYLRDYLLPVLGKLPMTAITKADIQRWADSMTVGKAGEGQSIKRHVWELLSGIFREACKPSKGTGEALLKVNPVVIRVDKPTKEVADGDATMEEVQTIAEHMPARLALIIYLVGVLGLRPGEAYALERQDIEISPDHKGGVVHVTKSAKPLMKDGHKVMVVGSTKTKGSVRDRDIPMFMLPIIEQHLETFVEDKPASLLFTGERTRELVYDQSVRNAYYRARKSVPRLDEKKFRLYDLRHRALTAIAQKTNSLREVMDAGGHTQVSTALHYQHSTEAEREKINAGLEADWEAMRHSQTAEPSASAAPDDSGVDDGMKALAGVLESMPLDARVQVLKGVDEGKRARVLACLSQAVQVETLTALLGEVK